MKFQKKALSLSIIVAGMSVQAYGGFFSSTGACTVSGPAAKCQDAKSALNCIMTKHPEINTILSKLTNQGEVRITMSQRENGLVGFAKSLFVMTPSNPSVKGEGVKTDDSNCLGKLHNYKISSQNGKFILKEPEAGSVGPDTSKDLTNFGLCRTTGLGAKCTSPEAALKCIQYEMNKKQLPFASVIAMMSGESAATFLVDQAQGGYGFSNTKSNVTIKPYGSDSQVNVVNFVTENPNCLSKINNYNGHYDESGKLELVTSEEIEAQQ